MPCALSLYLCFLCTLLLLIFAQNTNSIPLGSSIKAGDNNSSPWLSPSGDFAFGFKEVASGSFLLAIWFDKTPEKTITWSANRDQLAQDGSVLQLSLGKLVLSDPSGQVMWSTPTTNGLASSASILDTGNFVLLNQNNGTIWQSFDHPTDTILPDQKMVQGTSLISQLSASNYSSGRFNLSMNGDGRLVFSTLNWPENSIEYFQYYSISTQGNGTRVVYNQSGSIYIDNGENGSVVAQVLSKQVSSGQFYQRAVLEFDGVFRKYSYPRPKNSTATTSWTMQDFAPQDICSLMQGTGSERGRGACGFNSYCQMRDDHRPECLCPEGYVFFDQTDQIKGCKPDFVPQSCSDETQESNRFSLVAINDTNFWGADYDTFVNGQSERSCKELCLSDCLCAAVVFNSINNCWKKRFPLSNGWRNDSAMRGTVTYIKVGNGDIGELGGGGKNHHTLILIESILLGGSGLLNVVFIILAIFTANVCAHKWKPRAGKREDMPGTNIRNFSFRELEEATNGFREVVGQGAFARVYKGSLDYEMGMTIAVKKFNNLAKENQREFESEVQAIARTGHRNLVQLIGFCNEEQHRLLVYKYMPNGSLADVLFQGPKPSWSQRIKFAFEMARGLNYLHEECGVQIIHCDIKPQNVLLDESFTTRISDFGLAKLLRKDQTQTMTGIRGTKGYVAPEWFKSMPITTKVDVYSYGILLLELVCCRKCFMADAEDESQMVLADWAYDCYKERMIGKLVEGDEEAMVELEKVEKLVMVALWCTQDVPSERPSMKKVIQMIQDGVEESLPPDLVSHNGRVSDGCDDALTSSSEALL